MTEISGQPFFNENARVAKMPGYWLVEYRGIDYAQEALFNKNQNDLENLSLSLIQRFAHLSPGVLAP